MNSEENKPKPEVETYATHMAEVVESGESGSEIKKIIEQDWQYQQAKTDTTIRQAVSKAYLYGGILLIGLSLALVFYQLITNSENPSVEVKPPFQPLIFTDESSFVEIQDLDKKQIADAVALESREGDIKEGGVKGIHLMEAGQLVSFSRFLELIQADMTGDPNLFGENFMIGTVQSDKGELFILLPVRTFGDAFNKMRTWEGKMFFDLHGLFDTELTSTNNFLLTKDFVDTIVENKNTRVLAAESETALMYVFADENFIIISRSHPAVREVILRLASSKIKK